MPPGPLFAAHLERSLAGSTGELLVVRAPIAPLMGEPRVSAPQVTQALAGSVLAVQAREGEWVHALGVDDYAGWVHGGYLTDVAAARRAPADEGEPLLSLDCVVDGPFGTRRLPLGALLMAGETVLRGEAVDGEEQQRRFPPHRAEAIVETAMGHFGGTSYQWGGVTPWGADCSGIVQSSFALHGVSLPRDAWQQALEGEELAGASPFEDPAALRAADLLFFSDRPDGRITHVGMATGDGRMVHLSLGRGGYAVERLAGSDDAYVRMLAANFRLARRLPLGA